MAKAILIGVLGQPMAMHREAAHAFYADVLQRAFNSTEDYEQVDFASAKITNQKNIYVVSEFGEAAPPENAPDDSVAVIGFGDVITKYDDYWYGVAGTVTKADLLQRALNNPKVKGAVLWFDSPGGMSNAPVVMLDVIRNATKPVHAFVDGYCASAAYEIAAACDKIWISGDYTITGSIGSYVTVTDFKGVYEKWGVKIVELYATESTLKNADVREAFGDPPNTAKLQAWVDKFNALFLASVKQDRGDLITDAEAFNGKAYIGKEAIDAGLADGFSSLDGVVKSIVGTRSNVRQLVFLN